jgi:excisionase family DNA binding protein
MEVTMIIDGITYITVKEAAEILDVSDGRVRQFIMEGRLFPRKIAGRINVLPLADVQAFARLKRPPHKHIDKEPEYE